MNNQENKTFETRYETAQGAVASMVCGILGLVLSFIPAVGLVLGIIALILYSKATRRIMESGNTLEGKGMSNAGLVCGILAFVWGSIYFIYCIYWIVTGSIFRYPYR